MRLRRRWTEEELELAIAMRRSGASYLAICRALDRDHSSVRYRLDPAARQRRSDYWRHCWQQTDS